MVDSSLIKFYHIDFCLVMFDLPGFFNIINVKFRFFYVVTTRQSMIDEILNIISLTNTDWYISDFKVWR